MVYLAAVLIVAGVALFVAAPLAGGSFWRRRSGAALEIERLEHERELAMQGLRDLEFDREMGKLSDADYAALKAPLEARALNAMGTLARLRAEAAPSAPAAAFAVRTLRAAAPVDATTRNVRFCPACGTPVGPTHKFCGGCGAPLETIRQARAEAG